MERLTSWLPCERRALRIRCISAIPSEYPIVEANPATFGRNTKSTLYAHPIERHVSLFSGPLDLQIFKTRAFMMLFLSPLIPRDGATVVSCRNKPKF